MGTTISFKRPDGKDASGYLARPGRADAPGIVVIQEWWGLQDQIKGICDRFALAGYEALAPDLYAGTVVPYHDADAANREMSSLNFLDATDQVVRGAAAFLKLTGVKVGLTGFCMGGAVTILGAIRIPELSAASNPSTAAGVHQSSSLAKCPCSGTRMSPGLATFAGGSP